MSEVRPLSASLVKAAAIECGADLVGIAPAGEVTVREKYLEWVARGYAGEMDYMTRRLDERFDPRRLLPDARSVIVVGLNYHPSVEELAREEKPYRVAHYAWGEDYHNVLRKLLQSLFQSLKSQNPEIRGKVCIDSAPFMDKYWAQMAGLGWQGKNTVLVSRQYGFWLTIGSLIIDRVVDRYDSAESDHCGKCEKCIRACPTAAFPEPRLLDATRCISYWTTESKAKVIPGDIRSGLSQFVFGCDICLSACPFNRFQKPRVTEAFARSESVALLETGRVFTLSDEQFKDAFKKSPISRPGLAAIRRNILAARG